MKRLFLLLSAAIAVAAETPTPQEGYERAIARYKSDACSMAKALAREEHDIVEMNPGCRCERTDGRQWQCDIEFTYRPKQPAAE